MEIVKGEGIVEMRFDSLDTEVRPMLRALQRYLVRNGDLHTPQTTAMKRIREVIDPSLPLTLRLRPENIGGVILEPLYSMAHEALEYAERRAGPAQPCELRSGTHVSAASYALAVEIETSPVLTNK